MNEPVDSAGRREFFRRIARLGVLGLLAGGATLLVTRAVRHPEACDNKGPCGGCRRASTCRLPRAAIERLKGSGPPHG